MCAKLSPFGCAPLFVDSVNIEFNPLEIIFLEIGLNTVCFRYIGQIKWIFRSLSAQMSSLFELKLFIVSKNSINNVQQRVLQRNSKNSDRKILKFRKKEGCFEGGY